MRSSINHFKIKRVKGWFFDAYSSGFGEVTVWVIQENGDRVKFVDRFQPKIYVSGKQAELEKLITQFFSSKIISSWNFVHRYVHSTDSEKSVVLEIVLKDCRKIPFFTSNILKKGGYLRYEVHNCDLHGDRTYIFSKGLFPLAKVELEIQGKNLKYSIFDSVKRTCYDLPNLRTANLSVGIAKKGKVANFSDSIHNICLSQAGKQVRITSGDDKEKLLWLVSVVKAFDPDIILTRGGDSYLFSYLIQKAAVKKVLDQFDLNRDSGFSIGKLGRTRSFFSYGRTYYKAPTMRLYGRIHIDINNTFVLKEADFDGLFEVARLCRVPLHTASRSSIGSSMSSLQLYQAIKDGILIPRNKSIPETFKSAYNLLIGDRGGFVYEPKVGIHDGVGAIDFSSMYPMLMVKNNISAETVLCKCCLDSKLHIPDLNFHVCEKRIGIVPKALDLVVSKRLCYKKLKDNAKNLFLKQAYDNRQLALKWILVTCFGYLGYRNAKFGTVDGHMAVCAFGRQAFLSAARQAEDRGFEVIHGIVDSLWLKKDDATIDEYSELVREAGEKIGVPLTFEGTYKWIVFLPSILHPNVGVLNRYYGVMKNGKVKIRGLEVRRSDTSRFVYNAQMDMINALASANDAKQFMERIPEIWKIVKTYRQKLLNGDIPIGDLIVTKHLSKNPNEYVQKVSQAIAAQQLCKAGAEVHAGKNVSFLFTNSKNKKYERRVKAEQLVDSNVHIDFKQYLLLLYSSAASLLSFAGYTPSLVYDAVGGYYDSVL
jgi:DNA polymerase elongation subunit (family B)